jgi:adenine specific DNA methylase Mod
MPKEKQKKKAVQLRHSPIGQAYEEQPLKNRSSHRAHLSSMEENENGVEEELDTIPEEMKTKIFKQARDQRMEMVSHEPSLSGKKDLILSKPEDDDSDYDVGEPETLLANNLISRMKLKRMKMVKIWLNMMENMLMAMISLRLKRRWSIDS